MTPSPIARMTALSSAARACSASASRLSRPWTSRRSRTSRAIATIVGASPGSSTRWRSTSAGIAGSTVATKPQRHRTCLGPTFADRAHDALDALLRPGPPRGPSDADRPGRSPSDPAARSRRGSPLDHVARRLEDEDRLCHGVEDLPEAVCRLERAGVLQLPRRLVPPGRPRTADGAGPNTRPLSAPRRMRWSRAPGRRDHRRAHPRPQLQRSGSARGVPRRAPTPDHGLVDLGDHHRVGRPRDGIGPDRRIRVGWISATELLDQRDAIGSRWATATDVRIPSASRQVDRTPIRDAGDDQLGDLAKGRSAIQRRRRRYGPHPR